MGWTVKHGADHAGPERLRAPHRKTLSRFSQSPRSTPRNDTNQFPRNLRHSVTIGKEKVDGTPDSKSGRAMAPLHRHSRAAGGGTKAKISCWTGIVRAAKTLDLGRTFSEGLLP